MNKLAIRCTIHNGSWQHYENLHAGIATLGGSRTIRGDDGNLYSLPDGTYVCTTAMSVTQMRDAVTQIAQRVSPPGPAPLVIVFEWDSAAWTLLPAPPSATTPLSLLAALGLPAYR